MLKSLSASQVQKFNAEGFLSPIDVFTEQETRAHRTAFEVFESRHGDRFNTNMHLISNWAFKVVTDTRILDAVEDVLGPNFHIWSLNWFIKEPAEMKQVTMHQDSEYWGLRPFDVVTAWLALTDAGELTGPMRFLPGSHMQSLTHEETWADDNLLTRGQRLTQVIDPRDTVMAPLKAGQMSLHHVRVVHGSDPNQSDDRRIGMVIRFIATHVTQTKLKDTAMLVRGQDHFQHFDQMAPPDIEMGEAELARWEDSVQRMRKAIMDQPD